MMRPPARCVCIASAVAAMVGTLASPSCSPDTGGRESKTVGPVLHGVVISRIGPGRPGPDPGLFGDIRGLALAPDGRVLVADYQAEEIRVFAPGGEYQYSIGRPGSGPGELRAPCCIALDSTGDLWVEEGGNLRYSRFRLKADQGEFLSAVRMPTAASGLLDRVAWDPFGHVVHISTTVGPAGDFRLVRSFLDSTGTPLRQDTILDPPQDSVATAVLTKSSGPAHRGQSGVTKVVQPYGSLPLRAFGPKGDMALAVSGNYAISWFDYQGNRVTLIERHVRGPSLSPRERARAAEMLEEMSENLGISRARFPFGLPSRKAPVRNLGFDLDGRLIVERSVEDGAPREADVFDRGGRLVAMLSWPANIRLNLWTIRSWEAIGVEEDSLGTPSVVRMHFAP